MRADIPSKTCAVGKDFFGTAEQHAENRSFDVLVTVDGWSDGTSQGFEDILDIVRVIAPVLLISEWEPTILRCRLNERIFFRSLMDTFGSISLLINRMLLAISTVLQRSLSKKPQRRSSRLTERIRS